MAVSINYSIVKSSISGGYQLAVTLSVPVNLPDAKLLVLKQADNTLDRVASVNDIEDVPDTSTVGVTYYRSATANVQYFTATYSDALAKAIKKALDLPSSLQNIVNDWNSYQSSFVGTSAGTKTSV